MNDDNHVPQASAGDHLHSIARAGLGSIPVVGSVAVELFNFIVSPPLERRRDDWRQTVGERIHELERRPGFKIEDLANNEAFIDVTLQASAAAMRTHQKEKIDALRNAVVNAALDSQPDKSLRHLFVHWVDELTVDHIRVLKLFHDPEGWFTSRGAQLPDFPVQRNYLQLMSIAYPELEEKGELCTLVASDLMTRGLFTGKLQGVDNPNDEFYWPLVTGLGVEFLDFISEPKP